MPKFIAPRIHVLLARATPTALVLRHGPHQHWQFVWWNRETDVFTYGGALRGKVFARRCDLSLDGMHLLLCVERYSGIEEEDEEGAWTAITQVPSLHPLTLISTFDNYHGGGVFMRPLECWIDFSERCRVLRDDAGVHWRAAEPGPRVRGDACRYVHSPRLIRDGWTLIRDRELGYLLRDTYEKRVGAVAILRKQCWNDGGPPSHRPYNYDTHAILDFERRTVTECPDWEWADFDGNRMLWASKGKLHAAVVSTEGIGRATVLKDFNPSVGEPLGASP